MFTFIAFICNFILLIRFATTTDVGGVLLQNTIWTKANNPYHVIADVQVPRNVTLTIKAGVQIIYDNLGDYEMLVKGYLQVQGTAGQHVIFDGSAATDDIKPMLTFKAANLSQSLVVYAQFVGPKLSAQLAEVPSSNPLNTGELVLQFCTFIATEISTEAVIFFPWSSLAVPTLVVKNSTITDSIVTSGVTAPEAIKLLGNDLQNVTINTAASYGVVRVAGCRGGNVSITFRGLSGAYFEINDTRLTNVLVSYSPIYWLPTSLNIYRSTLLNATILLVGTYSSAIGSTFNLIDSKFTVPRAIEIETGSIQCTTITSFGNSSNSTGIIAGSIAITNSSIFGFNVGLNIYVYSKPMNSITNSNFYKNSLYNIANMGDSDVNATGNWWGTKTGISNTLDDYWKNINYGEVFFTNYAQSLIEQQC